MKTDYILFKSHITLFIVFSIALLVTSCNSSNEPVRIAINLEEPMQIFGASKLEAALETQKIMMEMVDQTNADGLEKIQVELINKDEESEIQREGYRISKSDGNFTVTAIDQDGAMYGLMDLAEQIEMNKGFKGIEPKLMNPHFQFRAIKYNLPYHSYRENPGLQANNELSRDLDMWTEFLDMMAENRLNALTLWSVHPYPYMIRAKNFPKATPFTDAELAEWKSFWTSLFKMAKERGIETYLLNWNICVSQSYVENYGEGTTSFWADGYTSPQLEQYTRETVTQVINEYPDLTGLGITMGEAMQGWSGEQETEWMDRTFFAGIRAADRKVKFIYRAALDGDHNPHRNAIDNSGLGTPEDPVIVELKFNWSHAHSTPTLVKAHGGGTGEEYWTDPAPTHHKMAWMIRNEDFFRLRWGEPNFIRKHIEMNDQDYVGGYFIGSECYIPSKDFFHKQDHAHVNWKYAFERQWLYYKQWGRLLYDPSTPDEVFENAFNQRFEGNSGEEMVEAYHLSTQTTQRIGSFFNFTWDHTLYIEGFVGNKRDFISLEELINANPIEPNYVSIKEFGDGSKNFDGKITPLELATALESDNQKALDIVKDISTDDETLKCEMADVEAWAYLGLYFAKKIRTAVAMNQDNNAKALANIQEAQAYWQELVKVTDEHIQPGYSSILNDTFHWKFFQEKVDAEVELVKNL